MSLGRLHYPRLALSWVLVLAPLAVEAQETKPTCRWLCGFSYDKVVSLGDADMGVIDGGLVVERVPDGYMVSHRTASSEVLVFSETGEYLRSFGRDGDGPGEFRRIASIQIGPDGNIWIHDSFARRITVMTLDGEVVETHRAPWRGVVRAFEVLPHRSVLFNVGMPVEKVGHITGWTSGYFTRTCYHGQTSSGYYTCGVEADYSSLVGDSGAPVFRLWGGNNVVLYGLHHSRDGSHAYFASWDGVLADFEQQEGAQIEAIY